MVTHGPLMSRVCITGFDAHDNGNDNLPVHATQIQACCVCMCANASAGNKRFLGSRPGHSAYGDAWATLFPQLYPASGELWMHRRMTRFPKAEEEDPSLSFPPPSSLLLSPPSFNPTKRGLFPQLISTARSCCLIPIVLPVYTVCPFQIQKTKCCMLHGALT